MCCLGRNLTNYSDDGFAGYGTTRSRSSRAASNPRNDASLADQVTGGCSPPILASMVLSVPKTKNTRDHAPDPTRESLVLSSTQSVPLLGAIRSLSHRPSPELGLLSLLFVLSMAVGSVLSMAIVSFPTIIAFRKMADSMSGLSKVVAEKCPERCPLSSFPLPLTDHLCVDFHNRLAYF